MGNFCIFLIFVILVLQGCHSTPKLTPRAFGSNMRSEFLLHPEYIPLNHGSYGTYPKAVQRALRDFQDRIESNPDVWIRRDARNELDKVRAEIAKLIGADAEDIVVVPNTTSGINAILRSMIWQAGDKILHFSTVYGAMRSLINYVCDVSNGTVTSIELPLTFPISTEEWVSKFEAFVTEHHKPEENSRIRFALIDHITSVPCVINPIERFIPFLKSRGILVMIDGAHAVGQVPIDLRSLSPDYYITNTHKWLYSMRSAAILYVSKERQSSVHPAIISSNYDKNGERFQDEFFWTGTIDYSPYMTIPAAMEYRNSIGGEVYIMDYNKNLSWIGGQYLAEKFGTVVLQEEDQFGSCIDVQLPLDKYDNPDIENGFWNRILLEDHNFYAAVYKHGGRWWTRVSTQVYNDMDDFKEAARIFGDICNQVNRNSSTSSANLNHANFALLGGMSAFGYMKTRRVSSEL